MTKRRYSENTDLKLFGAMNDDCTITAHGKLMLEIGLHPRIAHMLLKARELNLLPLACELAALMTEQDIFIREIGNENFDLRDRIIALRLPAHSGIRRDHYRRAIMLRDQLLRHFKLKKSSQNVDDSGLLLAFAYADRIGQLRENSTGSYRLYSGRGAQFVLPNHLEKSPFIVAALLDGAGRNAKIFMAAPLTATNIFNHFADEIKSTDKITWNTEKQAVEACRLTRLGPLVLKKNKIIPSVQTIVIFCSTA